MRSIIGRFKSRTASYREVAVRPLTPTDDDFKALDKEVEELQVAWVVKNVVFLCFICHVIPFQAKKVLVQDDFKEKDPYEGLAWKERIAKKYFKIPQGKIDWHYNLSKDYWITFFPALHPQGRLCLFFVGLQTAAFLYNAWAIPLRFSFHVYQVRLISNLFVSRDVRR